jgi:hypothetical protein
MGTVETKPKRSKFSTARSSQVLRLLKNSTNHTEEVNSPCADAEIEDVAVWIVDGGIILVILGMIVCFWGLAEVCDNYFCASLLVLCEEKQIPENVFVFNTLNTCIAFLIRDVLSRNLVYVGRWCNHHGRRDILR